MQITRRSSEEREASKVMSSSKKEKPTQAFWKQQRLSRVTVVLQIPLNFNFIELIWVWLAWLARSPPREKGHSNLSFYSQNHLLCLSMVSGPAHTHTHHRPQVVGDLSLSPSLSCSLPLYLSLSYLSLPLFRSLSLWVLSLFLTGGEGMVPSSITRKVLFYGSLWQPTQTQNVSVS